MLIELLPHFARLMPMADKFLSSRNGNDGAQQEAALAAVSESVRGNLGQVTEMHSGVQRALKEQAVQMNEIAVEVTRTRMGVESIEARMNALDRSIDERVAGLEAKAAAAMKMVAVAMVLLVGTAGMLVFVVVRLAHR